MTAYLETHLGLDERRRQPAAHALLAALRRDAARADAAPRRRPAAFPARDPPVPRARAAWSCATRCCARCCTRLPGRKLVFSNSPVHYSRAVLAVLRVADLFDDVFSIEHTRYRPKPDRRGFLRLLRKHRLQPRRCIMVEDSLENLQTAKRLGMRRSGSVARSQGAGLRRRIHPACGAAPAHAARACT